MKKVLLLSFLVITLHPNLSFADIQYCSTKRGVTIDSTCSPTEALCLEKAKKIVGASACFASGNTKFTPQFTLYSYDGSSRSGPIKKYFDSTADGIKQCKRELPYKTEPSGIGEWYVAEDCDGDGVFKRGADVVNSDGVTANAPVPYCFIDVIVNTAPVATNKCFNTPAECDSALKGNTLTESEKTRYQCVPRAEHDKYKNTNEANNYAPNTGTTGISEYCYAKKAGGEQCGFADEVACGEALENALAADTAADAAACYIKGTPGTVTPPNTGGPGTNTPPNTGGPGTNPNTPPNTGGPGVPDNTFKVKLSNPLGNNITNINQLLTRFVQIALDIGLILASLAILYSGFLFVKAQGDSKKITDARNRLQWSVIGLAILLASNVIVTIIKSTVESLSVK